MTRKVHFGGRGPANLLLENILSVGARSSSVSAVSDRFLANLMWLRSSSGSETGGLGIP